MIYEMRTYTFNAGALPKYIEVAQNIGRPVRGNDYGHNYGYWIAEHGALNQIWHLWSYDSFAERDRLRGELAKNKRWTEEYVPAIRPLLARQDLRLWNGVLPVKPPAESGNIYELRIYRTNVGQAKPWSELFKAVMPAREKYSKNVGVWTGEFPQPNEVAHMWAYKDGVARAAARAAVQQDPEWKDFLAKAGGMLAEMQSTLLIPAPFSSMK